VFSYSRSLIQEPVGQGSDIDWEHTEDIRRNTISTLPVEVRTSDRKQEDGQFLNQRGERKTEEVSEGNEVIQQSRGVRRVTVRTQWSSEMKTNLLRLYDEETRESRTGYMKRLKKRWDEEMPQYQHLSASTLSDNARRFIKNKDEKSMCTTQCASDNLGGNNSFDSNAFPHIEATQVNVSRMDYQEQIQSPPSDTAGTAINTTQDSTIVNTNQESNPEACEVLLNIQTPNPNTMPQVANENIGRTTLNMNENTLHAWRDVFQTEFQNAKMWRANGNDEVRDPLRKVNLNKTEIELLNSAVGDVAREIESMEDITNALYAAGKTAELFMFKNEPRKGPIKGYGEKIRNRALRELDRKIKERKKIASWAECEIHRRRTGRRPTRKEKEICQWLMKECESPCCYPTTASLKYLKVTCVDEIHMLKLRRSQKEKALVKRSNNYKFEKNEKRFYQSLDDQEMTGETPHMNEIKTFWSDIWEREGQLKTDQQWIGEVEDSIKRKVTESHEMKLLEVGLWKKIVKKRKNWTSPGPDGVQNYWLKKIKSLWVKEVEIIRNIQLCRIPVPAWMGEGRTVLIPKSNNRSAVDKYRPITCLNTLYKAMTSVIALDVQEYLVNNGIWDGQQKGTQKGILGTIDNLLVDRSVLEECKEYERNLAVAYFDYEKAYDSVPHEWQIRCFQICQIDDKVINILQQLHSIWKTRLELRRSGKTERSPWIKFKRGFFQGDSLSPVGFCICEIPIGIQLENSCGYLMGEPKRRDTKVNRFYYIDDLKVVQTSEEELHQANGIVTRISHDVGMRFGVKKCAEIIYQRGKMVKGNGMEILEGKISSLDPTKSEFYTFLGVEEANGQIDKAVKQRVLTKCFAVASKLMGMQLYERNLIRAINTKVMAMARYCMTICHFGRKELKDQDVRMRKLLLENRIRTENESVERLYLPRELGGRGLLSFELVYKMSKLMVAIYLCLSSDKMLRKVFQRDKNKETWKNPVREAEIAVQELGHALELHPNLVVLDNAVVSGSHKKIHRTVTNQFKEWWVENLVKQYELKVVHSIVWKELRKHKGSFRWMNKNVTSEQVGRILRVQEQMVETKGLQKIRGKSSEDGKCRLCNRENEGTLHWLAACEYLAGREYLKRHDQALRVFYAEVLKKYGMLSHEVAWFNTKIEKVRENEDALVVWNQRIQTHTRVLHRWPDLRVEIKGKKLIWLVDMSCPADSNLLEKEREKKQNYADLAFELKLQRPDWKVMVIPLVIGVMGSTNKIEEELCKTLEDPRVVQRCRDQMQMATIMGSAHIIHRIQCGMV
jgi:hypothetical protein